ncbi:DUF3604 domain-containing protein [Pseudomaricurvus alkylphenolicus]|nr:DUF3604 domain-containing protein [Pseudomaricurvus alkylphenolicus]
MVLVRLVGYCDKSRGDIILNAKKLSISLLAGLTVLNGGAVFASEASTQLLWGDTHLHTNVSPDAFLLGNRTVDPDTAYRFAKGQPVVNGGNQGRSQLREPLDFLVIADHAEMMGVPLRIAQQDPSVLNTRFGAKVFEMMKAGKGREAFLEFVGILNRGEKLDELEAPAVRQPVWNSQTEIADRHYQPGKFTTLIGWEWSSIPDGSNLHRVVFTDESSDKARQFIPFSANDSDRPEDLWQWLQQTSDRVGMDFVAIPHNSNISNGRMFASQDSDGNPLTREYARTRMRWEPVVEATQIKGDSETIGELSPDDEFADFESYQHLITSDMGGENPAPTEADYVRGGLKKGLALEHKVGINPFKFGLIGSTDAHSGLATAAEDNFAGKFASGSMPSANAEPMLGGLSGWDMSGAGLAAVWAQENTRESILQAFKRREVYSTTGPRIQLRLFAGFDFKQSDLDSRHFAERGYAVGVPMGGDLSRAPKHRSLFGEGEVKVPQLMIRAVKEPTGANLDRVQVVKGWLDAEGRTHERVYNVAWSDNRSPDKDGKLAPVGDTVNPRTGKVTNSIGSTELSVLWQDPDFDVDQRAFYYVRVLQIPTARHSTLDMLALGKDPSAQDKFPVNIQERAYSSPVWYTP